MPKVPGVYDHFDVLIFPRNLLQNGDGTISRAVVDEDVFIAVAAYADHRRTNAVIELAYIALFVVTGSDDADRLHQISLRSTKRPSGTAYASSSSTISPTCSRTGRIRSEIMPNRCYSGRGSIIMFA